MFHNRIVVFVCHHATVCRHCALSYEKKRVFAYGAVCNFPKCPVFCVLMTFFDGNSHALRIFVAEMGRCRCFNLSRQRMYDKLSTITIFLLVVVDSLVGIII